MYPKLKIWKNVFSDVWPCPRMLKQCYFQATLYSETIYCFRMAYSSCFCWRGNLDFPPKKFYNINCWSQLSPMLQTFLWGNERTLSNQHWTSETVKSCGRFISCPVENATYFIPTIYLSLHSTLLLYSEQYLVFVVYNRVPY